MGMKTVEHSWLVGYVESLAITPTTQYRSDCPVCDAKGTFSVSDTGTMRLFYCFHADCGVRGRTGTVLSLDTAHTAFKKREEKRESDLPFELPHTFVSLSRSLEAESYVKSVNSYDAYLGGLADLRYDFKKNRVAYLVKHGGRVVDAVGRSIDGTAPKWYRYGSSGYPFVCGTRSTAILVEDCASACCVTPMFTGVALMGTSLLPRHIDILKQFERVFVALDKDATDKAIDIVRILRNYVPTKIMVLRTDLKNMDGEDLHEFLRSYVD